MDTHMMNCMMGRRKVEQTMLGNWLREARGGRSQTEVAARIGMEQAEWSRWERGERKRPNSHQIRDFAFALGVPVESVALAYAGIWPGIDSPMSPLDDALDDPLLLAEEIARLTDRLVRLTGAAQSQSPARRSRTMAEA
jgi:transcriptional regulator with XRE-family HTH domain